MDASCTSGESWAKGSGCIDSGAFEARGGMEIREANGAVVCCIKETCGFHGTATSPSATLSRGYEYQFLHIPLTARETSRSFLETGKFPSPAPARLCGLTPSLSELRALSSL